MAEQFPIRPELGRNDQLDVNRRVDRGTPPDVGAKVSPEQIIAAKGRKPKEVKLTPQEQGHVYLDTAGSVVGELENQIKAGGGLGLNLDTDKLHDVGYKAYAKSRDSAIWNPKAVTQGLQQGLGPSSEFVRETQARHDAAWDKQAENTDKFLNVGVWGRFKAAYDEGVTATFVKHMEQQESAETEDLSSYFAENAKEFGNKYSADDLNWLASAHNRAELADIQNRIEERNTNARILTMDGQSSGILSSSTVIGLAAGVVDPVSVATIAAGGMGINLLRGLAVAEEGAGLAGMYMAGRAATAAEGFVAGMAQSAAINVGTEATLAAMGEHRTALDYANAAILGGVMHAGMHAAGVLGAKGMELFRSKFDTPDTAVLHAAVRQEAGELAAQVKTLHEAGATHEQILKMLDDRRLEVESMPTGPDGSFGSSLRIKLLDLNRETVDHLGKVAELRKEADGRIADLEQKLKALGDNEQALKDTPVGGITTYEVQYKPGNLPPLPEGETTMKGILNHIVKTSTDEHQTFVAKHLAKLLKDDGSVAFDLNHVGAGPHDPKMAGAYHPGLHRIAYRSQKMAEAFRAGKAFSPEDTTTALHELEHALSAQVMSLGEQGRLKGIHAEGYSELKALYDHMTPIMKDLPGNENHWHRYATKNISEFMAVVRSDKGVQDFLRNTPYGKKQNAFTAFAHGFLRLLGVKSNGSALEHWLAASEKLQGAVVKATKGGHSFEGGMGWAENVGSRSRKLKAMGNRKEALTAELEKAREARESLGRRDAFTDAASGDENKAQILREIAKRTAEIVRDHPIDPEKLKSQVDLLGKAMPAAAEALRSCGLVLASSKNNTMRAMAVLVPELTTGAAGRGHITAAMTKQNIMDMHVELQHGFEAQFDIWAREQGLGKIAATVRGEHFARWESEVAKEIQWRRFNDTASANSPSIQKAADSYERMMQFHNDNQRKARVAGWQALPESSRGYMPQRMDPERLFVASDAERAMVRDEMAKQLAAQPGWDSPTAQDVAGRMITQSRNKYGQVYVIDFGMSTTDTGAAMLQLLREGGMSASEAQAYGYRMKITNQGHLRSRMDLDMSAQLPNGRTLGDYFRSDLSTLSENYAHAASGDVAMHSVGIEGKIGLQDLRQVAQLGDEAGTVPATLGELQAFDQLEAEMYGKPLAGSQAGGVARSASFFLRGMTSMVGLGAGGVQQLGEGISLSTHLGIGAAIKSIPVLGKALTGGGNAALDRLGFLTQMRSIVGRSGAEEHFFLRGSTEGGRDLPAVTGLEAGTLRNLVRRGASAVHVLNFSRAIRASQQDFVMREVAARMFEHIRSGNKERLGWVMEDMGLTPELVSRIGKDMPNFLKFNERGEISHVDLMNAKDVEAREAMLTALKRGANQLIQGTQIGERGRWVHDSVLSFAGQFRSFPLLAAEKQFARTRANVGTLKALGFMSMQMMGTLPLYYAKVQLNASGMQGEKRDEYLEQALSLKSVTQGVLGYTTMSGMLGDATNMTFGLLSFGSRANPDSAIGDIFGNEEGGRQGFAGGGLTDQIPALGMLNRVGKTTSDLYQDPSMKNFGRFMKSMPMGNHPLLAPLYARMATGTEE